VSAWSPLLRRSVRLARRSPVRTAATGALVLVAVGVATGFLSVAWGDVRRDRADERTFGAADVLYVLSPWSRPVDDRLTVSEVVAAMPEGARTAVVETTDEVLVTTPEGDESVSVHAGAWDAPLLTGRLDLVDGHAPGPGEVVIPAEMAERTGLGPGDELELADADDVLEISGIGSVGHAYYPAIAVGPDWHDDPGGQEESTAWRPTGMQQVYVQLPVGATAPTVPASVDSQLPLRPTARDAHPADDLDVAVELSPSPLRTFGGILGLAAVAVGSTTGAAFGIGAARRRRSAGILAANGAGPRDLRIATASEVLVVALPAAVIGAVFGAVVPGIWVELRWPLWSRLVDVAVPWPWVAALVLVALLAAVLGALVLSRSLAATSTSALLDERTARRTPGRFRLGAAGWILIGLLALTALSFVGRLAVAPGAALLVGVSMWLAVSAVALAIGRALLRRDVVGRLVASDLRRRPVGSLAAVSVVAVWVFLAVVGTATDGFRFPAGEASADGIGTVTGAGVLVRPAGDDLRLPTGLARELADAGLETSALEIRRWTGECAVCPQGWIPTLAILESPDDTGLPASAVEELRSGAVVTGWNVGADAGSEATLDGVTVRVAPLSMGVDAVVLRSSIADGPELIDPRPALIGDTSALSPLQVAEVAATLSDSGLQVATWDPRIQPRLGASPTGLGDGVSNWLLAGLGVLLVLVTLAATAAHRREHGEAARVLRVLGAGPRAGRRLASLTAGSLAGVGAALGLSAALLTLSGSAARSGMDQPFLGLWNRSATLAALAAVAVPLLVAALARVLPDDRRTDDPRRLGPA